MVDLNGDGETQKTNGNGDGWLHQPRLNKDLLRVKRPCSYVSFSFLETRSIIDRPTMNSILCLVTETNETNLNGYLVGGWEQFVYFSIY